MKSPYETKRGARALAKAGYNYPVENAYAMYALGASLPMVTLAVRRECLREYLAERGVFIIKARWWTYLPACLAEVVRHDNERFTTVDHALVAAVLSTEGAK